MLDGDGLPRLSDAVQLQLNGREQLHREEVDDLNRKIRLLKDQLQAMTLKLSSYDDVEGEPSGRRCFSKAEDELQFEDTGSVEEVKQNEDQESKHEGQESKNKVEERQNEGQESKNEVPKIQNEDRESQMRLFVLVFCLLAVASGLCLYMYHVFLR